MVVGTGGGVDREGRKADDFTSEVDGGDEVGATDAATVVGTDFNPPSVDIARYGYDEVATGGTRGGERRELRAIGDFDSPCLLLGGEVEEATCAVDNPQSVRG